MVTARDLLVRGLLAGLLAGVAAFFVAYAVGEPSVGAAISVEESGGAADHDHATASEDHEHDSGTTVPRSLQSTAGLATATVVAGVTLGGLVGVVSALALGRFGRLGVRSTVLLVTGLGLLATYVVPSLAYPPNPPNPPAVGQADTIGYRTALYFVLVAVSLIAGVTAVLVARRLAPRWSAWYATLACAAAYGVVMAVTMAIMPGYDEVPADFPAGVLYDFRRASLLTQVALWGVVGLVTAELAHRLAVRGRRQPVSAELVRA
jgi:predicted cobalt transporter CbtA